MSFKKIKRYFVFCCIVIFFCCNSKSNKQLQHLELGKLRCQLENDSVNYRIVCIIDGGCSLCIGDFVELNMNFLEQKDKYKFPLYYLVMTGDSVIFKSNLMKFDQELCGKLFVDTTYSLMQANQLFKESGIEVFLINKEDQIVISGNPFENTKVCHQYDDLLK